MPRKSAAEIATVVDLTGARIGPPANLKADQLVEWHAIVDSLPADYFRAADVSLLAAYCVAAAFYRQAQERMEMDGILLEDAKGRQYAHPAAQILNAMSFSMAQMATKLRLCPQARYDTKKAATKQRGDSSGKPWQQVA